MPRVAACLRPSRPIGYISLHAFLAAALGILSLGCSTDEAGPGDVSDVTSDAADSAAPDIDDAGDDADTMAPPDDAEGCDGTALYESPTEPDLAGPWPVGARTVTVADFQVEVWYPARARVRG